MNADTRTVVLAGTYTLDPFVPVLDHWAQMLSLPLQVRPPIYGRLHQQLLDPHSDLRQNRDGLNLIALRWEDLSGPAAGNAGVERAASEVCDFLGALDTSVPCLLIVGPTQVTRPEFTVATQALCERLQGMPHLTVLTGESIMERYRVQQTFDPAAERLGHVPYTAEAFAALGTAASRWAHSLLRMPVKVVAVDADHTLWSGVVGEDGVHGVAVEADHLRLQRLLVDQGHAGRLLCLLSKNNLGDIDPLFRGDARMALNWDHFVAHRVDWQPKADNVASMLADLDLGLDSVLFLDDSPMECAQMRARHPEVVTVRVPTDAPQRTRFADHLWLLDVSAVTAEDRQRVQMYRDNSSRAKVRRSARSLQDFLGTLALKVDMAPAQPDDLPRLVQLTQRTNQFNASLLRCDAAAMGRALSGGSWLQVVRASDRFGDYGIVGQMRAVRDGGRLAVDLFMLSCRALGRGIEHRMIAEAGRTAQAMGLGELAMRYEPGERNAPVRAFLESVFGVSMPAAGGWLTLPAADAARVVLEEGAAPPLREVAHAVALAVAHAPGADQSMLYETIACTLTTASEVVQAMSARRRSRPELVTSYTEPAAGTERLIADVWKQVLCIEAVGANDSFQDLGGKSVQFVQIHKVLAERLRQSVELTALFQFATVASLAAHLSRAQGGSQALADAKARGAKMREARSKAALRNRVTS